MTEVDRIETPAGPVWAATRDGRLVWVHFGGRPLEGRRKKLPRVRRWLKAWFAGADPKPPIALEGTPFTRKIYEVVRRIPRGRVKTYGEVADAAGRPGAARAVGSAMAKNPVCLFIPCHRVVGSDGLGGYSGEGGIELKKRLLALEEKA
ncbi:MAG TPA: methylated-DNA--[protein]-cysteine S-methyltransferase [Planctomycetota bacterium]